jgi:hypothetical protein
MPDNRDHITHRKLREGLERWLSNPAVRTPAKDIVRTGLNRDILDAAHDARQAASILTAVAADIGGGDPIANPFE